MSMREAFDIFFENNNKSWRRTWGTLPRVPRCDKYRQSSLIVAENDKFDELEWLPKLQEKRIDFNSLEEDLEFRIHPQIKDFLSTYWFMPLEGKTDKIDHLDRRFLHGELLLASTHLKAASMTYHHLTIQKQLS